MSAAAHQAYCIVLPPAAGDKEIGFDTEMEVIPEIRPIRYDLPA